VKVVAVVNYKGGVGKTTLAANIGAEIARWGKRVLFVDLDPQASLTFSFYHPEVWRETLAHGRTIRHWFDEWRPGRPIPPMAPYVSTPSLVNARIAPGGGRLDLIASDLRLADVELELAARLGGATVARSKDRYMQVFRQFADGLRTLAPDQYDLVILDCAPNFGVITRSAIVASDYLLIPARPDELSTLGIDHFESRLGALRRDYNQVARMWSDSQPAVAEFSPVILGVVFTMVQYYGGQPISGLLQYIQRTRQIGLPVFDTMVRQRNSLFAGAAQVGIPVILDDATPLDVAVELRALVEEFLRKIGAVKHG
jgi:chromosome partitioning protein